MLYLHYIRRPLFRGAPRLRVSDTICFSAVICPEAVFAGCNNGLGRPIRPRLPPPTYGLRIRNPLENPSIFKPFSRATKMRKVAPKASEKHTKIDKIDPAILKNDFCKKSVFAIPSMRKPGFETPRRPDFYSTIGTKSVLEASSEKNQNVSPRCQKNVQNGVPKSTQNL